MKVLITGGCGFLGSNLAAHALSRHDELFIYDNLSRRGAEANLDWLKNKGTFQLAREDIRDNETLKAVIRRFQPEGIFHLAGQVAMTTSLADPRLDFEVNAYGSFNLLEAVRSYCPGSVIVYSSTNKVYGDLEGFSYQENETRYLCREKPQGFDESTPLCFESPYGCSKGAADQYMLDYARMFDLHTIVFRHSSMYGGRQYATYDQGWIGWFCEKALEAKRGKAGEPFTISGSGKQVRDVLHAEDMIRLYYSAFKHAAQAKGEAFNIGGGKDNSLSLLELFALLEELTGVKLAYTKLPSRACDQKIFIADIGKAQKYFGWSPRVDKRAGIKKMLSWIENEK